MARYCHEVSQRRATEPTQSSDTADCWMAEVSWYVVPPNFNKGHIYHYLVETLQAANFDDGDTDIDPDSPSDTFTSKPLHRGELYYTSGHVTDVKDVRSENAYFVMAEVFASTKKVAHTVTVTLSTNSGFVTNATCQCKCAALGRCSHVGGVLHAVLDHASHGDDACSSQLCPWNLGKRKDKNPGKVTDVSYSGASSKRQTDGVILYDRRPSEEGPLSQTPKSTKLPVKPHPKSAKRKRDEEESVLIQGHNH